MVKKKKKQEEDFDYTGNNFDTTDDDYDIEEDKNNIDFEPLEEEPADSLGLARQISKESETAKSFKEMPKEVRYSYYDKNDKNEVKHFSRAYRTHKYIEKIIDLRMEEDEKQNLNKFEIKKIIDKKTFKLYLKSINREYLINNLEDLEKKDFDKIMPFIKKIKKNHMNDTINSNKETIKNIYNDYDINNNIPTYIDDMGNIGKIMDTSLTSMGFKGNASQHSVMTIQAVKNEDIQSKAESKRAFGFMDAIKNKLG